MFVIVLPVLLMIFGLLTILLSKSKSNYQKLAKNGGEEFARKTNKKMKVGGLLLFIFAALSFISMLLID
jgi:isoprenylcysteine carboxyl methyltransferase (ICMT) family protein YpbQ